MNKYKLRFWYGPTTDCVLHFYVRDDNAVLRHTKPAFVTVKSDSRIRRV